MVRVTKEIELQKETYELAKGIGDFVAEVILAGKDGFDGMDIPSIISSLTSDLIPSLAGVSSVGDEFNENRPLFYKTVVEAIYEAFKKIS